MGWRQDYYKFKQIYVTFLKSEKINVVLYSLLYGVCNVVEILVPLVVGYIMDYAVQKKVDKLFAMLLLTLNLFIFMTVMSFLKQRVCNNIVNRIVAKMKCALMEKVVTLPMSKIDNMKNGEILLRLEDCEKIVSYYISLVNNVLLNLIILIITACFMWRISATLSIIQFVCIPVILGIYYVFAKIMRKNEKKLLQKQDNLYNFIVEMLRGIKEIQSIGSTTLIVKKHSKMQATFIESRNENEKKAAQFSSLKIFISGFLQIAFLIFVCMEIINENVSIGMYYAFNSYANKFSNILSMIASVGMQFRLVTLSIDRVLDYIMIPLEEDFRGTKTLSERIRTIRLEEISFAYDGTKKEILKEITADFENKYFNVIVGANGCGKSTLLDVIMNFYKPMTGNVFVDDVKVNELSKEEFFQRFAYIRQNQFFFNASIMENMRLVGEEITDIQIENVCKKVGLHSFIMTLPEQYETELGELGQRFSGGELQRLALARALLKDTDVYILDEITSDLDGKSESIVMSILQELYQKEKLIIMVAHRLSTVIQANNIIVLEDGKIVAKGNHQYLIENCESYQKLFVKQWNDYKTKIYKNT